MRSNRLLELLKLCEKNDISYVCWKGMHKIPAAIEGKADIDLFVPDQDLDAFKRTARELDWFELIPAVVFKGVCHFYSLDSQGRFFHIHVYNKIRTGASYSKAYELNGKNFIEESHLDDSGVRVLNASLAKQVHFLRMKLRKKGLMNWLFFLKEKDKHIREENHLQKIYSEDVLGEARLKYSKISDATKFRSFCNIVNRLMAKVRGGKKKLPFGVVIAVTGTDGSGKSSLTSALENIFQGEMEVKRYGYGRPSFTVTTSLFWIFRNLIQVVSRAPSRSEQVAFPNNVTRRTGILKSIYHLALSAERFLVLKKCQQDKSVGKLVILDRCPTEQIGQMDGPKINAVDGLLCKVGLLEQSFYRNSSAPDLVLRLELSVEEAKLRNKNRDKFGKETDAEIEMRFRLFSDYVPKALSCVTIDSSKSIEEVQSLAVSEISALLSNVIVK